MSFAASQVRERVGRPTQFHGVSVEERAYDASGNRLPWALEFPDSHPKGRLPRKQPEEKGSFGRSTRRKTGSTRATRTQTPAKATGVPALESFEAALNYDKKRDFAQQPQSSIFPATDALQQAPVMHDAEPTQALLYGYAPDAQWAAIGFYESVSRGMICEDYDRSPPDERKRYHGCLELANQSVSRPEGRRTLTQQEAALAMQYRGGMTWIKVTFDSKEAAERAIAASPHLLNGYWVYANIWKGQAPERDEPIKIKVDRQDSHLTAPQLTPRGHGGSFGTRSASGMPQSPMFECSPDRRSSQLQEASFHDSPQSSTTASSATATGPELELRKRNNGPESKEIVDRTSMTKFPERARTVIRPAIDALLPVPTRSERFWTWLSSSGLVPGEIIGNTVPKLETGEFDWNAASYYWRFFKRIDDLLGTDMCGMRDN